MGQYPFLASLRAGKGVAYQNISVEGRHLCSGSLVAKNVVLTVAHCVNDNMLRRPYVYFNITRLDSPHFQVFNVLETRVHPKYQEFSDGRSTYDAALLVLDGEPDAPILRIRYDDRCFREGASCGDGVVLPWTPVEEDDFSPRSKRLQKAAAPLKSDRECRQIYGEDLITQDMICAGGGINGTCQGDSGGPLLIDDKVAGIVAFGYICGTIVAPDVYTNLAFLKDWLQQQFYEILGKVSKSTSAHLIGTSYKAVSAWGHSQKAT